MRSGNWKKKQLLRRNIKTSVICLLYTSIVITGKAEAVQKANEALVSSGAKRAILLNVSGPFHSPFLKEAGEKLGKVLEGISFKELEKMCIRDRVGTAVIDYG